MKVGRADMMAGVEDCPQNGACSTEDEPQGSREGRAAQYFQSTRVEAQ